MTTARDTLWLAHHRARWMRGDARIHFGSEAVKVLGLQPIEKKYRRDQLRVPAHQPGGGQFADEGGHNTDISAARRIREGGAQVTINGRTIETSPAKAIQLDAAEAQASLALANVRRLDPTWRPTPSFRQTVEGAIANARAERSEAEARYLDLLRVGAGPTAAGLNCPATSEVLLPGGRPIGSRFSRTEEDIRTLNSVQFEAVRSDLMRGAQPKQTPAEYNGMWYARPDGSVVGLRISRDNGLTIDVIRSDALINFEKLKVHQR